MATLINKNILRSQGKMQDPVTGNLYDMPKSNNNQGGTSVKETLSTITDPKELLMKKMVDVINRPSSKSYEDQYNALAEEKNIGALKQNVGTYQEEIGKTLDFLSNLKGNIKSRMGEYIVPESQRARIEASERAPLTQELETLQRGEQIASEKVKSTEETIKNILDLREKESGKSMTELKDLLGITSDYKKITEPDKADTDTTEITGSDGKTHKILYNKTTGETIKDLGPTTKSGTSSTGAFTKSQIGQMSTAGLDEDTANDIYKLIQEGSDLDSIRKGLTKINKNPVLLDIFDRVVGISKILGQD